MPLQLSQRSAIQWTGELPLPALPTPPCLCFWVKVLWSPDLGTPRCHEPVLSLSLSPRVPRYWPLILAIPRGPYPTSLSTLDISRCPCHHPLSTPRCSVLRCGTPQTSMPRPSLCSQVFCSVLLYILYMPMSQVLPRALGPLARLSLDPVLRCQALVCAPPSAPRWRRLGSARPTVRRVTGRAAPPIAVATPGSSEPWGPEPAWGRYLVSGHRT